VGEGARSAAGPTDTDLSRSIPHHFHRQARDPRRDLPGVRMLERTVPVPENRSIM
jgi:hypothetical protein